MHIVHLLFTGNTVFIAHIIHAVLTVHTVHKVHTLHSVHAAYTVNTVHSLHLLCIQYMDVLIPQCNVNCGIANGGVFNVGMYLYMYTSAV